MYELPILDSKTRCKGQPSVLPLSIHLLPITKSIFFQIQFCSLELSGHVLGVIGPHPSVQENYNSF